MKTEAVINENCVLHLQKRYIKMGGKAVKENGRLYLKNNGFPLKEYVVTKAREKDMYHVQITNIS